MSQNPKVASQKLRLKSAEILNNAVNLIERFQKSSSKLASHKISLEVTANWEAEMQQTLHILDVGKRVGEQKMEHILTGSREQVVEAEMTGTSKQFYDQSNRIAQDVTWASVVRKQEKKVRKLVHLLPRD